MEALFRPACELSRHAEQQLKHVDALSEGLMDRSISRFMSQTTVMVDQL
jgi:hypothetical protein